MAVRISDLQIGSVFTFPQGVDSGASAWTNINGDSSVSGVRAIVMELDSDTRPIGVHLWHEGEFCKNHNGARQCFWFSESAIANVTQLGDMNRYFATFTENQLQGFTVMRPDKLGLVVRAETNEQARKLVQEDFGDFHEVYVEEGIELLGRELGYLTYTFNELLEYKKPPRPEGMNKDIYLSAKFGEGLCDLDDKMRKIIPLERGAIAYCIPSNNAFGSSDQKHITMENGVVKCDKQTLRLGRVIKAMSGDLFDDTELETIVSRFKTKYEIDTSSVKTSDDVRMVYGMSIVGGSCMATMPSETFDIYHDMQSSMVYLENEDGELDARALIHQVVDSETGLKEYTVMDRIFYNNEKSKLTLQQWRREQEGMTRIKYLDFEVMGKYQVDDNYEKVPYIDTLCTAIHVGNEIRLSNGCEYHSQYDYLQETHGGSQDGNISNGHNENDVFCYDTEEYVNQDDTYYCETDDNHYQYDHDLVHIDGRGYFRDNDDDIAYDEHTCEYRWADDLKYCESEGIYTSNDDYVTVEAGRREGSYEDINELTYCDDVDGYVMSDEVFYIKDEDIWVYDEGNYYQHDNGDWYSYEQEADTEGVA